MKTKRHATKHILVTTMLLLVPLCLAPAGTTVKDATHVTVRHEKGRCLGWPANGGIWSWGNEILVQYKNGEFQDKPPGSHDFNFDKPVAIDQSRSLDGGLTWTHHATTVVSSEDAKSPITASALTAPIDFSNPSTILKFDWAGYLYYSTDRGVNWRGPFSLPKFDLLSWQLRTDYLVEGKNTCIAFWSGSKERFKRDENGGMVYMVKTTDGGLTWTQEARVSRVVEPSEQKHDVALMPATVRISPTKLVTCLRNLTAYPKVGWIDCRVSTDNGRTWSLQSKPVGDEAGTTPPALSRLADGRLVLTYGYRKPLKGPTSIRAKLSEDDGKAWGDELILRTGGGDEDIGYTRNTVRPDGKIVTIYYWQENEKAERDIAATIWTPPAPAGASAGQEKTAGALVAAPKAKGAAPNAVAARGHHGTAPYLNTWLVAGPFATATARDLAMEVSRMAAGPLTELILLGNIAIRTGKRLEWDGAAMRFTNDAEANRFVKEPYNNGWSLEA